MTFVFDTSALIPLVVPEIFSASARVEFRDAPRRIAPDFFLFEAGQVLWKKGRRGEVVPDQVPLILGNLTRTLHELVPAIDLIARAHRIAVAIQHSFYDCIFLALAEQVDGVVVTADEGMGLAVVGTPWAGRIRLLAKS